MKHAQKPPSENKEPKKSLFVGILEKVSITVLGAIILGALTVVLLILTGYSSKEKMIEGFLGFIGKKPIFATPAPVDPTGRDSNAANVDNPVQYWGIVKITSQNYTRIRLKPDDNSERLLHTYPGDEFIVLEDYDDDWFKVMLPSFVSHNGFGYILKKYTESDDYALSKSTYSKISGEVIAKGGKVNFYLPSEIVPRKVTLSETAIKYMFIKDTGWYAVILKLDDGYHTGLISPDDVLSDK